LRHDGVLNFGDIANVFEFPETPMINKPFPSLRDAISPPSTDPNGLAARPIFDPTNPGKYAAQVRSGQPAVASEKPVETALQAKYRKMDADAKDILKNR
jgi:hypothetical protein